MIEPALAEALRRSAVDGDVEILLQPIVALSDRKVRMYDVFPRLRLADGSRVTPAEYWAPAHQLGLALVIERQVVTRAAQILRKLGERGKTRGFFCRLSQTALADRGLIAGLAAAIEPKSELAENIVIELSARDYLRYNGAERDGLAELARMGVRFALEGTETLVVDRHKLASDRIHYLKMSPTSLAAEHRVAGFQGMASLISDLRRAGIDVILDQVTDEGIAALGTDCGIILGQGPAFGVPRPLAPEFLGEIERSRVASVA
jgi:cyclic-di-GMP phosphodiesterase, flagellum assembly factor TipF